MHEMDNISIFSSELSVIGDESETPRYLRRNTRDAQRRKCSALSRGENVFASDAILVPKWRLKPRLDDPLARQRLRTSLDSVYGTIYKMRRETTGHVFKQGQPLLLQRETTESDLESTKSLDIRNMREKSYIRKSNVYTNYDQFERKQFGNQIIQYYKKPISDSKPPSYCSPRDPIVSGLINNKKDGPDQLVDSAVQSLVNPQNEHRINTRRKRPKRCRNPDIVSCQWCDVLGPQSCSMCIEVTNRHIAHDVESKNLPDVDQSILALLAPNLPGMMATSYYGGQNPGIGERSRGMGGKVTLSKENSMIYGGKSNRKKKNNNAPIATKHYHF